MKILVSAFTKFYRSISSEWLAATLTVFAVAAVLPNIGKVWHQDEVILWVLFLPMLLLRNFSQGLDIPPDQGMIVLILLGTPLAGLYWVLAYWGVRTCLRLIFRNHFSR